MNKKITAKTCVCLTFFIIFAVLLFGCGQTLQADTNCKNLIGQAKHIIDSALVDSNPRLRTNAAEVVVETKQLEFMPKVIALLKDPIIPVRFSAIIAVGDTRYTPAEDIVKKLLDHPDKNIRIAAGYTIAKFGSSKGFNILGEALTDKNLTVRANATVLLGKTGDTKAIKPLYWVLEDSDSDDKVRFQAVEAIARLGDESVFPKLWAMLISAYADDRAIGVRGMGALRTRKAKDVLYTMLDDEVAEVRLIAAEQLGILGDPAGTPQILEILQGKVPPNLDEEGIKRIKILAALAIGKIATPDLTNYLPKLLEDKSPFVRLAAAKSIFNCVNLHKDR